MIRATRGARRSAGSEQSVGIPCAGRRASCAGGAGDDGFEAGSEEARVSAEGHVSKGDASEGGAEGGTGEDRDTQAGGGRADRARADVTRADRACADVTRVDQARADVTRARLDPHASSEEGGAAHDAGPPPRDGVEEASRECQAA
ncbi:MAG: hypothetical protein ABIR11_01480 [Candidatus Limnocylindrales bacterium]